VGNYFASLEHCSCDPEFGPSPLLADRVAWDKSIIGQSCPGEPHRTLERRHKGCWKDSTPITGILQAKHAVGSK